MKKLSDEEHALIDEVTECVGSIAGAELECLLNGSITRFNSVQKPEEDVIRALAATHGVELWF